MKAIGRPFTRGTSGNPAGSKPGTPRINRRELRRAFNTAVAPFAAELMQRAVGQALAGDSAALAGVLGIIGAAMGDAGEAVS